MAWGDASLPFGCRDIKLRPINVSTGVPGTSVPLPYARTLSFSETAESTDLEANDTIVTSHEHSLSGEWELESGGIAFAAWAAIAGGAVTTTGSTPNRVQKFRKKVTDIRPFVQIEAQMISDSGGDVHVVIHRARATENLEGEFTQGEFFLTKATGKMFPSQDATSNSGADVNTLYDFLNNETVAAIA